MRLFIFILIILLATCKNGLAQGCPDLISRAEEDYRKGQFEDIKPKLCKCFGIYATDKTGTIMPSGYRTMIDQMKIGDTIYSQQLGAFKGYWQDFVMSEAEFKERKKDLFSSTERNRAFILLGKLYNDLGALKLSEYFAFKAIQIEPNEELNNDSTGFNRTYGRELEKVKHWSIGPLISWLYAVPVNKINNMTGTYDFKAQHDGKIVLGPQLNYYLKPTVSVSIAALINSTRVVYTQTRNGATDFYHTEKQDWFRMPVLINWSSEKKMNLLKENGVPIVKWYISTGFSACYLANAKATIIDLSSHNALYDYDAVDYRNKYNFEYILQVSSKVKLGRNYLNFGLGGSYFLRNIVNQKLVGDEKNELYTQYGIRENNYKLLTYSWIVSYEFVFTRIKK